jgi:hypothetical protein
MILGHLLKEKVDIIIKAFVLIVLNGPRLPIPLLAPSLQNRCIHLHPDTFVHYSEQNPSEAPVGPATSLQL